MRKSKALLSLPVVSLEEGHRVGFVRHLVINPQTLEIVALVVGERGLFKGQKIVPFSKVATIGDDAITVDRSNNAERPANLPQIVKFIKDGVNLLGTMVVGENGRELGHVVEFMVDPETGKIAALELSGKYIEGLFKGKVEIPVSEVRTIGRDAIIVRRGAETRMTRVEGNWQETLGNLKLTGQGLWHNAVRRVKELPRNARATQNFSAEAKPTDARDVPNPADEQEPVPTPPGAEAAGPVLEDNLKPNEPNPASPPA